MVESDGQHAGAQVNFLLKRFQQAANDGAAAEEYYFETHIDYFDELENTEESFEQYLDEVLETLRLARRELWKLKRVDYYKILQVGLRHCTMLSMCCRVWLMRTHFSAVVMGFVWPFSAPSVAACMCDNISVHRCARCVVSLWCIVCRVYT